jgi:hypothetical protein
MKLISEYLERCQHFRNLAATEDNPDARKRMEEQAEAYYKLAGKRARELGQPVPPAPQGR